MTEREVKLVVAALLHDIGKVIYRTKEDNRQHAKSGADFLGKYMTEGWKDVLDALKYHHAKDLKGANLQKDALAYLVYMADNIASAMDRREKEGEDYGFEMGQSHEKND